MDQSSAATGATPRPLPLPIRVLVKGASTVGVVSPMGGSRTDFTFPRVIESELLAHGRPAVVRAISVASERTKSTLRDWERQMIGYSPDVVVLGYGHYETVHLFLPWWLERHANSQKARAGRIRQLYRKRFLRPTWLLLAQLQAKLDRTVDPTIRRGRPRQVVADLERLIGWIRYVQNPLIYLLEYQPPATRYRSWFPGMAARIEVMNSAIEDLVKRLDDPDIRYFRTTELVQEHADGDLDVATPDGFHFSADLHRAIGRQMAAEIMDWADAQEHLKMPD